MREDLNYYIWTKGDVFPLGGSKFFSTSEFACHCNFSDCIEQKISKSLIQDLISLRQDINEPITITSAFRCTKYQNKLRDDGVNTVVAKKSTHELGQAVDLVPSRMKIPTFMKFCEKYFEAIGIAKTFLHIDERKGKIRRWNY